MRTHIIIAGAQFSKFLVRESESKSSLLVREGATRSMWSTGTGSSRYYRALRSSVVMLRQVYSFVISCARGDKFLVYAAKIKLK